MKYFLHLLGFYFAPAVLVSFCSLFFGVHILSFFISAFILPLYYFSFRKKINHYTFQVILWMNMISYALLFLCLLISQGSLSSAIWNIWFIFSLPFFIPTFLAAFTGEPLVVIAILLYHTIELMICFFVVKPEYSKKKILIVLSCIVLSLCGDAYIFLNSPSQKYKGHDFEYMEGFSSTDLEPFFPYTKNNKLVTLKEPSSLIIENPSDMPILDGAEACYPVYAAIANAVYMDIDQLEKDYAEKNNTPLGKIVTFYNTAVGYERLFNKEVDMFFGAKPSPSQQELAKDMNVQLEYTPIGKEAFVFFVNKDNPINNISSEDMKKIYHGDITNWKDVGGNNQKIIAFQRPERSGSQSMMLHFMGDVSLKEPLTYEMASGMGGIIKEVAEYHNENGALGYTFKYFLEGLNQEKDVKILSIDGVYPTIENIKSGDYPLSTHLYCVTLKDNQKPNVKKLLDYLVSEQGQYIIEKTGYCGL